MSKLTIQEIIDSLKQYSILELNDLVKGIEQEFNISANFSVASAGAGGEEAKEEAQSEFNLHLTNAGANKIGVIKIIRELTGLGLMEAKKIVDTAPALIKEAVPAVEAEELKKKFVEAGATVELK
ncbi:50S ribosomal protein L7/L12 [Candidatus Mycoplasma haematobovis]|uniref:Large ribosomal subunit protein bL12 n=1 Tax=Candidatus Mycoplasma haematobovis TaxID=432608 RepID=A0A1A9QF85_9MOLU|nr:50S ribosomal protein L7/L12 [Candidatus Mycoplasma haematobovis]OAL10360.1 50S ribosomal protein L7/L12 [Candidatus Mycoplasma haematobovis]